MFRADVVAVGDGTVDVTAGVLEDGTPGVLPLVQCVDGLTPVVGCQVLVDYLDGQPVVIATIGAT